MLLSRITSSAPDFESAVAALCDRSASSSPEVDATVRDIITQVRTRGDAAVAELTAKFDQRSPGEGGTFEIPSSRWDEAAASLPPDILRALERAAQRIRTFHTKQLESGYTLEEPGIYLELRVSALDRAGIYVPGGTAAYPSSVLMNAIPAQVAGVREIVMVTPGATVETLAAARIAGVDRVFEIGGAQAVAALAYGTGSVPQVDKIVGPGNKWVAAAKRLVYGDVDIDSIAGPSEVLIVADEGGEPRWIAADLLAQAEHDVDARAILVTTSAEIAARVEVELARQLAELPRAEIARASLETYGTCVVVDDIALAIALTNRYAAEHVELQVHDAVHVADQITNAGAIFVGVFSAEAIGDYIAGPNHVLPTSGAARYASPLGVYDFRKRTSIIRYAYQGLMNQVADITRLAKVEGLDAHGRSAAMRLAPAIDDDETDDDE